MNKVISGINDFPTTNPELLVQWDYEKNDISPTKVSKGSDTKRWWLCEEFKHSHSVSVASKTKPNPTRCTVCKGRQVLSGFNDLETKYPDVALEWDYTLNESKPSEITSRNHGLFWWKCKNHPHSYQATCNDKTKPSRPGCPYCFGNKVLVGFNDINTSHPQVAKIMLSPDPTTISRGYNGVGVFQCENEDHTYECLVRDKFTHGIVCPICYGRRVLDGFNSLLDTDPYIKDEWDYELNTNGPEKFSRGSNKTIWLKCMYKDHSYERKVHERTISGLKCSGCVKSIGEKSLLDFIKEIYSGDISISDRTQISPLELDIFLPEKNIALEFNGVYYHSEKFKDNKYHNNKYLMCSEKGIKLIQIWEDDWNNNQEVVKTMLKHKIGVSSQDKVPARNTVVKLVPPKLAKNFLEENHIQGSSTGSIRIGLYEKKLDELVALMVLKNTSGKLSLERFATSKHVIGGQSKLLSYIDKNISYDSMITFADLTVSDGNLYEKTGWIKDKDLPPDYKYLYRGKLHHKFNFRLKRFREDPNLVYKEGFTERDLASLNGLLRVYDAGKIRYIRSNPNK